MTIRRRLRTSIRAGCALAVMAGGLLAAPVVGEASATVSTCSGLGTFNYSSGLGINTSWGNITANYTYGCEDAYYQNSYGTRVGQNTDLTGWSNTYPYSGDCALASFSYGYNYSTGTYQGSGLLIGGSVAVATAGNSNYTVGETAEIDVMAPLLAPCLESSSTGSSTATFVGTY